MKSKTLPDDEAPGKRQGKFEYIKYVAKITTKKLVVTIVFLVVTSLVLAFRVGEALWPMWIVDYRTQILGVVLLVVFFLILLSPVIVEVNSNPRPLSGPGKNPRGPQHPE
ncbi:MAG: hypothetical protein HZB50_08430 [Chloroflexi bacterium]|nr:hypothetical protein [Chloroflexota bacterium]